MGALQNAPIVLCPDYPFYSKNTPGEYKYPW